MGCRRRELMLVPEEVVYFLKALIHPCDAQPRTTIYPVKIR